MWVSALTRINASIVSCIFRFYTSISIRRAWAKNTQERHLGTRSAPICRRGRQSLPMLRDACVVVVARQGRVDRYILEPPPVLEYWSIDRGNVYLPVVRNPEGTAKGGSVSFSLRFCGRSSSGYFRCCLVHLALSWCVLLSSKKRLANTAAKMKKKKARKDWERYGERKYRPSEKEKNVNYIHPTRVISD